MNCRAARDQDRGHNGTGAAGARLVLDTRNGYADASRADLSAISI